LTSATARHSWPPPGEIRPDRHAALLVEAALPLCLYPATGLHGCGDEVFKDSVHVEQERDPAVGAYLDVEGARGQDQLGEPDGRPVAPIESREPHWWREADGGEFAHAAEPVDEAAEASASKWGEVAAAQQALGGRLQQAVLEDVGGEVVDADFHRDG
jgi:hypothetical protein